MCKYNNVLTNQMREEEEGRAVDDAAAAVVVLFYTKYRQVLYESTEPTDKRGLTVVCLLYACSCVCVCSYVCVFM